MEKLTFVLAALLLFGATEINGDKPSILPQIHSEPSPITAPDVLIEPILEANPPPPPQQINGRLLTPEEGCGYSSMGTPRVVGGGPARNGAYPWMALLGYRADYNGQQAIGFNCGGSLITSRHILTAAHCLGPNLWFARLGEHDIRTLEDGVHEDHEVMEQIPHTGYNKSQNINDVALLRLDDVAFNNRIRPICLPISDDEMRSRDFSGLNLFAAGWGQLGAKNGTPPYMKHVQMPVLTTAKCREVFARYRYQNLNITKMTTCAGGVEGQSICMGDSGGPLMSPVHVGNGNFSFYQVGVTSWTIPCAWKELPAGFMSVQYFSDWIHEKIQQFQQVPQ